MIDFINSLDIPSLLLGSLIGAFVSFWLEVFVKRPKLIINGSGGGGGQGPGHHKNYVTIYNEPALFGIKISNTTILGFQLHGHIEKGLVIDRAPAQECSAFIFDKETNEFISQLYWKDENDHNVSYTTITLNSGKRAQLMLFARLNSEESKYFIYQPESLSNEHPRIPDENSKFSETREFIVKITYSYGKKTFKFPVKVTKKYNGKLEYNIKKSGGGSF